MLDYPCRVLLIEDEPEDVNTIETMLGDVKSAFFQQGFELVCAETLTKAQKMLSREQFDVILLALMLRDSRQIDSLQELQELVLNVPIIVQTALEDEVIAVKALELGASGYLPKVASDRHLLLYAIRSAIERQRQRFPSLKRSSAGRGTSTEKQITVETKHSTQKSPPSTPADVPSAKEMAHLRRLSQSESRGYASSAMRGLPLTAFRGQLANIEQSQQQQKADVFDNFFGDISHSKKHNYLLQEMPDIFEELIERYCQILDRFVEQKIYQVEYTLANQINIFIEQLGYLQATPRDLLDLHTAVLKQKKSQNLSRIPKIYTIEGRYLLLELMGKLAGYYRRYYIGLNEINLTQHSR